MTETWDQSFANYPGSFFHEDKGGSLRGYCVYKEGVATIFQSEVYDFKKKTGFESFLTIDFHYGGRTYRRTITGKKFTELGIARKAGQFIRETLKNIKPKLDKKTCEIVLDKWYNTTDDQEFSAWLKEKSV